MHCTCGESVCDYCLWKMKKHARAGGRRHFRNVMRHVRRRIASGEMDKIRLARVPVVAPVPVGRGDSPAQAARRAVRSFLHAAGVGRKAPGA